MRNTRWFLLLGVLISGGARADFSCSADFEMGVLVADNHIRVMQDGRTRYQINPNGQLIVDGRLVELPAREAQMLQQFEGGLRYTIPKMVTLASEGIELAIETVQHVYQNLVGESSSNYERMQAALERVREKVMTKYVRAGDNFFIGPRSVENVDELMEAEIELELEHAFNTTIGGLLSAIGGLSRGDGDNEGFSSFDTMGAEIERQVGPQAQILRKKARWFCGKLQRLDSVEEALRVAIPALAPFNMITTGDDSIPSSDKGF
ncbi:DUF2884 family protein [Bowmanella sp. JS7-9]|uniref:DUF2884 family protein n=1 Tax=Pseudobowmanella zhangzhouensis TaxID=1537679 RepID=A0ABW1XIV5_9ALTE|nr:DUF2884 family protein [Bowmanella sp. JS7-9]